MSSDLIRALRSGRLILGATALLLAGCGGGATRLTAPREYGALTDLVAWVTVAPDAFRAGESVQIELGVRNPTYRPIRVAFAPVCVMFDIRDMDGHQVAPGSACLGLAVPFDMAPGEAIVVHRTWDGTSWGSPVPPGEYRVGSFGFPVDAAPAAVQVLAP